VIHKREVVLLITAWQWTVYLWCHCTESGVDILGCLVTGVRVYHLHTKVNVTL
jgi:hypothetical protein